jgi:hypothetical protein
VPCGDRAGSFSVTARATADAGPGPAPRSTGIALLTLRVLSAPTVAGGKAIAAKRLPRLLRREGGGAEDRQQRPGGGAGAVS